MEQLAKFITDERTGLKYELCGDYYIIAGEDEPEREPIVFFIHIISCAIIIHSRATEIINHDIIYN